MAYLSLVWALLEYAESSWDPHFTKGITATEKIHRDEQFVG